MFQRKVKSGLSQKHCFPTSFTDNLITIKVTGLINSVAFQKARLCTEKLCQHMSFQFAPPQITEMFQIDWHEYIQKLKRQLGGKIWSLTRPVIIFINNYLIGSDVEFLHFIGQTYICSLPIELGYYESLITEQCKRFMELSKRKYVYFTFAIEGCTIGSFIFMLYTDLLPLTCQHFLNLCSGFNEIKEGCTEPFYVNTCIHRIVRNGWIQCGGTELSKDVKNLLENPTVIPDESYSISHDRRGVLSMANAGKHCNESQFTVCLKPNPWMDYYYVAFGQLIDGANTLKTLESIPTDYENPTKQIVISHCGEYLFESEPKLEVESSIFHKHQEQLNMAAEDTGFSDHAFNTYSITPWLDNIVDRIDVRDTASLLMAEQYLSGLHCRPTDSSRGVEPSIVDVSKIHELLMNFQPDMMTEGEKLQFVSEISNIILAYIFNRESNEFCLKHIAMDTRITIYKILQIAHKIAVGAIAKTEKKSTPDSCVGSKLENILGTANLEPVSIADSCLLLLREILNEAILYLIGSNTTQEQ